MGEENLNGKIMTTQTCYYKGRQYQLLWSGPTKFGRRAKLSFSDGSKEFWVALSLVSHILPTTTTARSRRAPKASYGRHSSSGCQCTAPLDEGDGECMRCGYMIGG